MPEVPEFFLPEPFSLLLPQEAKGRLILICGTPMPGTLKALSFRGFKIVVTGITERVRTQLASEIIDCGSDISFAEIDIERHSPTVRFSYVFCLISSVHFRNPLAVLERLADVSDEGLSFVTSPPLATSGWSFDPSVLAYPLLKRLPGLFLIPSSRKKSMDQAFALNKPVLLAFFKSMRQDFANVSLIKGERVGESVVIARKRRIGQLHILAGVNAVGKSTMLDKLRSGERPDVARALGLDPALPWVFTTYTHLLKNSETAQYSHLVVQYNITAPAVHGSMHGHHHGLLDLIKCAVKADITTMWLPHGQQKARYFKDRVPSGVFSAELHEKRKSAKQRDVQGRIEGAVVRPNIFYFRSGYTRRKADRLLAIYANGEAFAKMYDEWFEFVGRHAHTARVVFQEPDYRVGSIADWKSAAEGNL